MNFIIIEDDPSARFILNRLLKKNFKCDVFEAENGEEGLKLLIDNIPDLILLDISMPVMDGINTLEIIRSNEVFKSIPVVVITALGSGKVVNTLIEKGICDYILKPIDLDESAKRIQKIIKRRSDASNMAFRRRADHVLVVDNDEQFKSFFRTLFGSKFIVHETVNGIEGLEIYKKYKIKNVFVSDRLSLLDKKIVMQKIKELDPDNEVSIYLLVNDLDKLSTRVFSYDGIIKKSMDKDLILKTPVMDYFKENLE